jgi:hypothetical protein
VYSTVLMGIKLSGFTVVHKKILSYLWNVLSVAVAVAVINTRAQPQRITPCGSEKPSL